METPYILKTNIIKEDGKLLKPIIMREYIGEPLSMRQRSNLVVLYKNYGETTVQGAIFHGTRALGKKQYDPFPREVNDSFYEDSEETINISPPPEPRPLTKFLNKRSQTTVDKTLEPSGLQPQAELGKHRPLAVEDEETMRRARHFGELMAKNNLGTIDNCKVLKAQKEKEVDKARGLREAELHTASLSHRETKLEQRFDFLKIPTLQRPAFVAADVEAEKLPVAQAEAVHHHVNDVSMISVEEMTEEKPRKKLKIQHWESGVVAFASEAEDSAGEQAPEQPEPVPFVATMAQLLVKFRNPVSKGGQKLSDFERGSQDYLEIYYSTLDRLGDPIRGTKSSLITPHPTKEEFVVNALSELPPYCSDYRFSKEANGYCEEWELMYGANRCPKAAERLIREPEVPLTMRQRVQDYREALNTKQESRFQEDLRQTTVDKLKEKDRLYHEEKRANETLDQERARQKADCLRAKKNRDIKKITAGKPLKNKRTPSEQRKFHNQSQKELMQARRAEEKQKKQAEGQQPSQ
jgi:hypothetical protein